MRINILASFSEKLNRQVAYIAQDKPEAARKFRKALIAKIKGIQTNPFVCRKSIYADDDSVRDLIFKGYTITFRIDESKGVISVFALKKHEQ